MPNTEEFKATVEPGTSSGGSAPRRFRRKHVKSHRSGNVARDPGGTAQLRAELIVNEQARAALQAQVFTLESNLAREAAQRVGDNAAARQERLTLEAQVRSLTAQLEASDVRANTATAAAVKEALQKADEAHLAGIHALEQHHQTRNELYRVKLIHAREQVAALTERLSRSQLAVQELQRHNQELDEERSKYRGNLLDLLAKFERAKVTCSKWEQETTALRRKVQQLQTNPPVQLPKDD